MKMTSKLRWLACSVALLAGALSAQEIGYIETFGLAPDREAALKELVPGTDDYYYFHSLQAQNTGQRERFREVVDRWVRERNGQVVDGARELLNRQALLDYDRDPQKTLQYLREQLDLHFDHARKTGERRSSAPTKLDITLISPQTLLKRALAVQPSNLEQIEDAGLDLAAGQPVTGDQRRNLLARLQRPDYPGLVDLILDDLRYRDSRGYGSLEIHKRLALAQLDDLLRKDGGLRNQVAFRDTYLARLAPENEADLETDRAAREAYLDRLWAFVRTLDPLHNSLKAHVLYHQLRLDQKQGSYNHDRFLEYLKLPRNVPYLPQQVRDQLPRQDYLAQLDQQYGLVSLPAVGNDEGLVREFLLHFFQEAPNYDEFKPWVRDDFLKPVFAEAKIVNGIGDPQQWAPLLSPDDYRRLKERVDIEFAPDNPEVVGSDTAVKLTAFVKNVPVLLVKVYEINTVNYYRETGRPLNLALNLDGLVASSERRLQYQEAPERRVARVFDFPELKGRGAYVVELIGNGKSSRALVQKGRLGVLQQVTAAGHEFTVLDEAGRQLRDARAWLAGREFNPDPEGRIPVPFSTQPRAERLVVVQGGFAALVQFNHLAENYELHAGIYVDRESLLRREKAPLLVRPVLRVNGRRASIKLLEEPRLVLQTLDLQGTPTEKEFPGLTLREDAESVIEFQVPENAVSIRVTLKARVQNLSLNKKQDLAASTTFTLNGIDRTQAIQDMHVSRTTSGYILELRGKNGEPLAGEPLACAFKHRQFREEVHVELQTDPEGRAWLGELPGIESFHVKEPAGHEQRWTTAHGACLWPVDLHGRAGDTLRVPFIFDGPDPLRQVSLLEVRRGQFVRDWHEALGLEGGFLEIRNLPAGDYSLYFKPVGQAVPITVTQGEELDGFIMSAQRALERPRLAPLQITSVEPAAEAVDIHLANVTPLTRVHVFATRYLPAYDIFAKLGFAGAPGLQAQTWRPARTFYESGRDIGDEYRYVIDRQSAKKFPGNMLERPGLLLNPWALRTTEAQTESLAEGREYAGTPAATAAPATPPAAMAPAAVEPPEGYASLDFLKEPGVVILNLMPDKEGRIRIPRAELKGKPQLRILAVDPLTTVLKDVALEDTPVHTRELRLAAGLDPAKTYSEQKLVTSLAAKGTLGIADAATARFEICDTVAKAYRLLATLGGNPTLEEFAFITTWLDLDAVHKREQYSKYACHELNFFLYHKDPEFFRTVIAPYLKNKKDKTFMDHWLLEHDLKPYLEPWRFQRLNVVEQILLGRRLRDQEASLSRDARDRADLIPPNPEDFNHRFDTAIQTGALETAGEFRSSLGRLRQQEDEKAAKKLELGLLRAPSGAVAAPEAAPVAALADNGAVAAYGVQGSAFGGRGLAEAAGLLQQSKGRALAKTDARLGEELAQQTEFYAATRFNRAATRRFFQKLDQTKEWAENNYYHLPIEQQLADLVTINAFWADYAAHDGKTPFLSKAFTQATRNFTEIMLALAVLDLPFKAGPHEEKLDGRRYTLDAAAPLVIFHREIREAQRVEEASGVLVAQHFFRADDRYRQEGNEQFDKYVTDEFLPRVVYGTEVVLTNPSGNRQRLQVLLQLPMGALPVGGGVYTRGVYVALEPYSTQKLEYYFYFPTTGKFPHYSVTVARNDQVVAGAVPFTFNVVARLTKIDKTSWSWISQNGEPPEVLAFLEQANLHRLDLNEIAWRMKDADWFKQATAVLDRRHVWQDTLWSYGISHNDPETIRAYLRHSPFADRCGLYLVSPLLTLDPLERLTYQHLEYTPLVNPRAHQVGAHHTILNNRFREQYQRLMKFLSYKPALNDTDKLTVAFYLALQDRIEEALDWFGRVNRKAVPEQLQCDYLEAYLALYRSDVDTARRIARAHADEPVVRWRNLFTQLLTQLDELSGGAASAVDKESRDQTQGALAASEPALEMQVEGGNLRLDYRNLKGCKLNFYPMDIELLFSRSPFLQEGAAQFSFIRPVLGRSVDLPAGRETLSLEMPPEFRTRNVMVEALAAGLRKTQAYYANTLKVQIIEAYGQLSVAHADTRKPVPAAYVKVYMKTKAGEVKFFKDGYTDLRGRFDYASLNTNELENAARLAVLILSPELGAVVREAAPPKR
jgi:hypothetical protein